jgi:hypothetical protein
MVVGNDIFVETLAAMAIMVLSGLALYFLCVGELEYWLAALSTAACAALIADGAAHTESGS